MGTEFWGLVTQFGFPMVVCGYLLVKFDGTIKLLGEIITKNTIVLNRLADKEGIKCE